MPPAHSFIVQMSEGWMGVGLQKSPLPGSSPIDLVQYFFYAIFLSFELGNPSLKMDHTIPPTKSSLSDNVSDDEEI